MRCPVGVGLRVLSQLNPVRLRVTAPIFYGVVTMAARLTDKQIAKVYGRVGWYIPRQMTNVQGIWMADAETR